MKRTLQFMVGLASAAASAGAQGTNPAPAADTSSVILAPTPAVSTPAPGAVARPASSEVDRNIASGLPGYSPPAPAPRAGDTQADKPKNQIPRLPVEEMARYIVHGKRLPTFRTRDLYTKQGLIELSFKEHPGLRIGNFFGLNNSYAYQVAINEAMYADRQDVIDTALAMVAGGDKGEADAMQQALIDESFENGTQEGPVGLK